MDYLLTVRHLRIEDDGEVFILAMTDKEYDPQHYILLQKSLVPDQQDIDAGLDGIHIEIGDQSRSAYRAIARIELRPGQAQLVLTGDGKKTIGYEGIVLTAFAGVDLQAAFMALASVANQEFPISAS